MGVDRLGCRSESILPDVGKEDSEEGEENRLSLLRSWNDSEVKALGWRLSLNIRGSTADAKEIWWTWKSCDVP